MKMIVSRPFKLLLDTTGRTLTFKKGLNDVPDVLVRHWYVLQHAEPVVEAVPIEVVLGEPAQTEAPAQEGEETATPAGADDKAALKAEAEALGIVVDGRWGIDRIKAAIAEAKGA